MPEGIPLTTLIKVIIGAIGACQMPSLPSQLPSSPSTHLHTLWQGLGGRRVARHVVWQGGILTIWNTSLSDMRDEHMRHVLHRRVAEVFKYSGTSLYTEQMADVLPPQESAQCEICCQS